MPPAVEARSLNHWTIREVPRTDASLHKGIDKGDAGKWMNLKTILESELTRLGIGAGLSVGCRSRRC